MRRVSRCAQRASVARVPSSSMICEPITQVPGLRCGARPPATPKLISPPQPAAIACVSREESSSRRRRRLPERQDPPRCEPRTPSPPPRSFGRAPRAITFRRIPPGYCRSSDSDTAPSPIAERIEDTRDSANRTPAETPWRCTAARPKARQRPVSAQDTRCRVQQPHAPPRRPPSDQARPMPFARRCWAPPRSRGSRACSSPRPRPSRRRRSGSTTSQFDRLAHHRIVAVDAGGVERAQHRPGPVDVVHAPAAVPASLR